LSEPPRSLRA